MRLLCNCSYNITIITILKQFDVWIVIILDIFVGLANLHFIIDNHHIIIAIVVDAGLVIKDMQKDSLEEDAVDKLYCYAL